MKFLPKQKILTLLPLLLLLSLACNLPYGIGMKSPGEIASAALNNKDDKGKEQLTALPAASATPTPIATATYLPTLTPTNTPQPTATATLVVVPSSTPIFPPGTPGAPGGSVVSVSSGPVAPPDNVLVNGSFDDPWPDSLPVAPGWVPFDNGKAHFGWYKDNWGKIVFDGAQAQLIEIINDQEIGNRIAGIYQTVTVIPGAEYELVIHGLIRSDEGSEGLSGNGYALQYAIDYNGGNDWRSIAKWITLPLPEHPREDPNAANLYTYGTHTVYFRPRGSQLTFFIRGWKRWPDLNEANFDIDAILLHGAYNKCQCAAPASTPAPIAYALTPTPTPPASPVCKCSANIYDCVSFGYQAGAQTCYNYCKEQGVGDIHHLDDDNDGIACEDLP